MNSLFKNRRVVVLVLFMAALAVTYYAYPKNEIVQLSQPLKGVPHQIQAWRMVQESELETDIQELLRADDTLNRVYSDGSHMASLFVAFFKTQRTGVSPHSPKVCLPGSGWVPSESTRLPITVPGQAEPIRVNRYIVSNGENQSVVIYWYQSFRRAVANEYEAKVMTIADALRYHRSDTSLVRVVVPATSQTLVDAEKTAIRFVQETYSPLRQYLPRL